MLKDQACAQDHMLPSIPNARESTVKPAVGLGALPAQRPLGRDEDPEAQKGSQTETAWLTEMPF